MEMLIPARPQSNASKREHLANIQLPIVSFDAWNSLLPWWSFVSICQRAFIAFAEHNEFINNNRIRWFATANTTIISVHVWHDRNSLDCQLRREKERERRCKAKRKRFESKRFGFQWVLSLNRCSI